MYMHFVFIYFIKNNIESMLIENILYFLLVLTQVSSHFLKGETSPVWGSWLSLIISIFFGD